MTLLMVNYAVDGAMILTDTLMSTRDREPLAYRHKVWAFPKLQMAGVVTGSYLLGSIWFAMVEQLERGTDLESINRTAPDELRQIWAGINEVYAPDVGTATIYLFGFSGNATTPVLYRYSSRDDFEPKRITPAPGVVSVKPPPQQFALVAPRTGQEFTDLAIRIREENDNGRTEGPVAIGGELVATILTKETIETIPVYRFDDYEELTARMPSTFTEIVAGPAAA